MSVYGLSIPWQPVDVAVHASEGGGGWPAPDPAVGGDASQAAHECAVSEASDYPCLLRGVEVERPDQAWRTDMACIPVWAEFLHLAATMGWVTQFALSWRLSNAMDAGFCAEALDEARRSPRDWRLSCGSGLTMLRPAAFASAQRSTQNEDASTPLPCRRRHWPPNQLHLGDRCFRRAAVKGVPNDAAIPSGMPENIVAIRLDTASTNGIIASESRDLTSRSTP